MASGDPKLGQLDSWRKDEITVSNPILTLMFQHCTTQTCPTTLK